MVFSTLILVDGMTSLGREYSQSIEYHCVGTQRYFIDNRYRHHNDTYWLPINAFRPTVLELFGQLIIVSGHTPTHAGLRYKLTICK